MSKLNWIERVDLKLYNKNNRYVRTIKDIDYSHNDEGIVLYEIPKTKCRFIRVILIAKYNPVFNPLEDVMLSDKGF